MKEALSILFIFIIFGCYSNVKQMKHSSLLFILIIPIIFFTSCKNNVDTKQDIWKDTRTITFRSENISLKLPNTFKRSSKYLIKRDIPDLKNDSFRLVTMQNALTNLEFEDHEVDVFVDTTQNYRFLIMLNTIHIPAFNKQVGNQLKAMFNQYHRDLERENFALKITELDTKIAGNELTKMLKFKYKYENRIFGGKLYKSLYFLFQKGQTIIVHEYSDNESEIIDYLWSYRI